MNSYRTRVLSSEPTVKIKINCGGGWEGHVFFRATHPDNEDIYITTNRLEDVEKFAKSNNLKMDEKFKNLVVKKLQHSKDGFIVPIDQIDELYPISSCSNFLKINFPGYY